MRLKTSCLTLAALMVLAGMAAAQWPSSPDQRLFIGYGVESRIVSDGQGGAFVIYTSYPGSMWNDCYLQKLDSQGYPQLFPPIQLDVGFGTLTDAFEAVTDGEGGVIVAVNQLNTSNWFHRLGLFRFTGECDTLYWNADPDTLQYTSFEPKCASDSAGGIYLLYGHHSDTLYMDERICLQHIAPNGERLWGDAGFTMEVGLPTGITDEIALCAD